MGVEDGAVHFEARMLKAEMERGGLFHTFGLTCMRLAVAAPGALRFLSELNHLRGSQQPQGLQGEKQRIRRVTK